MQRNLKVIFNPSASDEEVAKCLSACRSLIDGGCDKATLTVKQAKEFGRILEKLVVSSEDNAFAILRICAIFVPTTMNRLVRLPDSILSVFARLLKKKLSCSVIEEVLDCLSALCDSTEDKIEYGKELIPALLTVFTSNSHTRCLREAAECMNTLLTKCSENVKLLAESVDQDSLLKSLARYLRGGDYYLGTGCLEMIYRLYRMHKTAREASDVLSKIFNNDDDCVSAFLRLRSEKFTEDARDFFFWYHKHLSSEHVFSFASTVTIGDNESFEECRVYVNSHNISFCPSSHSFSVIDIPISSIVKISVNYQKGKITLLFAHSSVVGYSAEESSAVSRTEFSFVEGHVAAPREKIESIVVQLQGAVNFTGSADSQSPSSARDDSIFDDDDDGGGYQDQDEKEEIGTVLSPPIFDEKDGVEMMDLDDDMMNVARISKQRSDNNSLFPSPSQSLQASFGDSLFKSKKKKKKAKVATVAVASRPESDIDERKRPSRMKRLIPDGQPPEEEDIDDVSVSRTKRSKLNEIDTVFEESADVVGADDGGDSDYDEGVAEYHEISNYLKSFIEKRKESKSRRLEEENSRCQRLIQKKIASSRRTSESEWNNFLNTATRQLSEVSVEYEKCIERMKTEFFDIKKKMSDHQKRADAIAQRSDTLAKNVLHDRKSLIEAQVKREKKLLQELKGDISSSTSKMKQIQNENLLTTGFRSVLASAMKEA